jgi:type II secretory ATPase GspE/PulE/Tfp pilus assembly ATPase PilB-like protein
VMLVGETRDLETAQICVRAALTGHLVFSTIHTNDASTTVNRLVDIGIEPYLVASSLVMVVAQRLIRRLCPKCKEPYQPPVNLLPKNFDFNGAPLYHPKGCDACGKSGYVGRMAIYEILTVTEAIQEMITRRGSIMEIRAAAKNNGMSTLEESGYRRVKEGETSLEEVMRVVLTSTT